MRIGIVCYPTYGGSGVVATELGKALGRKGHRVHFISYRQPFRLDQPEENVFFHEVDISDYALFDYAPYELSLTNKLVDVARYEGLDLIHVHYAIPHASAAYMASRLLLAEGKRVPFITTLHGTDITLVGKDPSYRSVITFLLNESDAVTAVSEWLRGETIRHFGIRRKIEVIPNFICKSSYRGPADRGRLRRQYANNGEKLLIHISNFRKVKRVADLVRVYARVRKVVPSKLLLIGDGPERHQIEELCSALKVCDGVRMLGKIRSAEKLLAVSDLFLLPSETESFGLAALEAMAAGVPVISSDSGGLKEVNLQGKTGYLCPVGDVKGMAEKVVRLLKDSTLMSRFRKEAVAQADRFEISRVLPMYEHLYRKALMSGK